MTARKHPRMTLVRATIEDGTLRIAAPGMPSLEVRTDTDVDARIDVVIWDSMVSARRADQHSALWISEYLGQPAQFAFMDALAHRPVDSDYAGLDDEVSFADGYPLLLVSQSALDELNARLASPLPMLRFRPNLVVTGTSAHAEDGWRSIQIGEVRFDVVKACVRCVLTTVDPATGTFDASGEPLRTLLTYRRGEKGVTFGQNLIPRGSGMIRVGDDVRVIA